MNGVLSIGLSVRQGNVFFDGRNQVRIFNEIVEIINGEDGFTLKEDNIVCNIVIRVKINVFNKRNIFRNV